MDNDKRRIGIIIPPGNVAVEREFPIYAPGDVVLHYARMNRPNAVQTGGSILAMNDRIEEVADTVGQTHPEYIAYVCTSGSFLAGRSLADELAERIERATGVAAVVTSNSVARALETVGARSVYLIAPYPDVIMQDEVAFLEQRGFPVPGYFTFDCATSEANRAVSSEMVMEAALQRRDEIVRAGALFISCTNLLSMDVVGPLERALGVPVVSSNQATLWDVLSRMGLACGGDDAGSLLAALPGIPGSARGAA